MSLFLYTMINIISNSYISRHISGPKKVVDNLIMGLDKIGYPYVINKRLDACKRLWIHDDKEALMLASSLPKDINVVVGPNIFVLPRNIPMDIPMQKMVYIHPSDWAKEFWIEFGFERCPIEVWPTGIDTEQFKSKNFNKDIVLLYCKQRYPMEIDFAERILKKNNINYIKILYGTYREDKYIKLLSRSKYIVWVGRQESQGVALQEALAMDIPILVCDVPRVGHWSVDEKTAGIFNEEENNYTNTTSAPYFNELCGVIIKDMNYLEDHIQLFEKIYCEFKPREYVVTNLSVEKQAREFVHIYEKYFGLGFEDGVSKEGILKDGVWRNQLFYRRFLVKSKDMVKEICMFFRQSL